MTSIKFILVIFLASILTSCSKSPDVIYYNGKIHTLDSDNTVVEAIAVKDGKILELGKNDDIKNKYKIDNCIDLQGKVVIPGFIESDGSLVEFSLELSRFNNLGDLRNCTKVSQIIKLVEEKVKSQKDDSWVGGYGWNENNLTDANGTDMDKTTLDKISTRHNIYLINADGTIVWCNSKILETLQITKQTPAPLNGEIDKDDNGELTGFLFGTAVNLIKEKLPKFTKEDMLTSIEAGAKELLKYGITEVHDRSVNSESISAFRELIDSGKFPIRMYAVLTGTDGSFDEFLKKGIEVNYKNKLTVRAVTVDYDGSVEMQSAAMHDDYKIDPKRKVPYTDDASVEKILNKAIDKNFQFTIKTVGDLAVSNAINIIGKVMHEKNAGDKRIVLEAVEFIQPVELNKIKEYKIIPSLRPEACMYDIDMLPVLIPPANYKNFALWNSLLQYSGMVTVGTGFPFSHSINPFIQMYYLTKRQFVDTLRKNIPSENQTLSILDALKSYTVWPAYSGFEEKIKGSLEKGKFADMLVISEDIFNSDTKLLLDTKVLKTIINGKILFESKQ